MKGKFTITNAAGEVVASGVGEVAGVGTGILFNPQFAEFCDTLEKDLCAAVGVPRHLVRNKTESDERSFAE